MCVCVCVWCVCVCVCVCVVCVCVWCVCVFYGHKNLVTLSMKPRTEQFRSIIATDVSGPPLNTVRVCRVKWFLSLSLQSKMT